MRPFDSEIPRIPMRADDARRVWLSMSRAILLGVLLTAADAAPPSHGPDRPAVRAGVVRLDSSDYVEIEDLAQRLDLDLHWIKTEERLRLSSAALKIELVAASREATVDGVRVLLGQPTRWHKKTLCLGEIDARKLLAPLVRTAQRKIALPAPIRTIVLDPGHGGGFVGTQNERLRLQEKVFTLDLANRVRELLLARGYGVLLTREDDRELSTDWRQDLQKRAEFGTRAKADLFLSLHFNAAADNAQQISGVEVFRYTPRFQTPVGRMEKRPDDDEKYPNDGYGQASSVLGLAMQKALLAGTAAPDRGLRHDKLAVLKYSSCPAVLIEGGYLSNDEEGGKIARSDYRDKLAAAIVAGVEQYARVAEGAEDEDAKP
jgi:N-acetylmuramoyl-L-alanine amidase